MHGVPRPVFVSQAGPPFVGGRPTVRRKSFSGRDLRPISRVPTGVTDGSSDKGWPRIALEVSKSHGPAAHVQPQPAFPCALAPTGSFPPLGASRWPPAQAGATRCWRTLASLPQVVFLKRFATDPQGPHQGCRWLVRRGMAPASRLRRTSSTPLGPHGHVRGSPPGTQAGAAKVWKNYCFSEQ
jgi:hypothetical protein